MPIDIDWVNKLGYSGVMKHTTMKKTQVINTYYNMNGFHRHNIE